MVERRACLSVGKSQAYRHDYSVGRSQAYRRDQYHNSRHSGAISLSIVCGSTVPVLRVCSCRKASADSRGQRGARWRCRRHVTT